MNTNTDTRMADVEFSSISSFLENVEIRAELKQVSTAAIFSFRIPKGGIEKLIDSKQRLCSILVENNKRLSIWVEAQSVRPSSLEIVVLRSMYVTNKNAIELVESHIDRAKALRRMYDSIDQLSLDIEEEVADEPPF